MVYAEGEMVEVEVLMVGGVESRYLLSPFLVILLSGDSIIRFFLPLLTPLVVLHWLGLSFHLILFFFPFLSHFLSLLIFFFPFSSDRHVGSWAVNLISLHSPDAPSTPLTSDPL